MPQELSYTRVTRPESTPGRWLYVVHGIYGTGRNWGSLARRLVDAVDGWGVILVDLRLHGGSAAGFDGPHTVAECAADLRRLEASLGIPPTAILGHSFGGKVALLRAAEGAADLEQVWVADSTLDVHAPEGTAWRVVEIVRELPPDFASRDELVDAMAAHGYDRPTGQWLAMNLEREGDRFRWRLDWSGIEELLRDFFQTDVWPVLENPPPGMEIHVIRAMKSTSLDEATVERLRDASARTGRVHLHEVDAGHWLNVDNPDAVLSLLEANLG